MTDTRRRDGGQESDFELVLRQRRRWKGQPVPSPTGFRFGVLLQSSNRIPVENKVHFPQMALGSQADRVTPCAKLDHGGVLDEGLPLSKAGVQE